MGSEDWLLGGGKVDPALKMEAGVRNWECECLLVWGVPDKRLSLCFLAPGHLVAPNVG